MAIDLIKIRLPIIYREQFLSNKKIQFTTETYVDTKESKRELYIGDLGPMKVEVSPFYVRIIGSIHYYHNWVTDSTSQNWSDFTIEELRNIISYLIKTFGFDPDDAIVERIEFGVNIETSFVPRNFLSSCLITYKYKKPCKVNDHNYKGYYTEFCKSRYYLKIYDKGSQFGLDYPLSRVELKYISSEQVRKIGVNYLSDLYNDEFISKCQNELTKAIDSLLITDTLKISSLINKTDKLLLMQGLNANYWESFNDNNRERRVKFKKIKKLLEKHNMNKLHLEIRERVIAKFASLTSSKK